MGWKETVASFAADHLLPHFTKVVNTIKDVPKDVADMKDKLDGIQKIIHDADSMAADEEDNTHDGIEAKVKEMIETSFRMENIIDEYTIHEERKLGDDPGCVAFPCKSVDCVKTMASRLQFAYMNEDVKSGFGGLKERNKSEDGSQTQSSSEQGPSSSGGNQNPTLLNLRNAPLYIKEAEVVGFDGPRDKLIDWLIKGSQKRTVISVEGMGGLGKTTLAKKVFDNQKVIKHFDCHAWITVSRSYTVDGLLKNMLQIFYKENEDPPQNTSTMPGNSLINEVRSYLQHKRYVVVFDDVWNKHFWDQMEFALPDDENGSRIFITTRNKDVAMCCKRSSFIQVHELQPLSPKNSLELFYKKAFGSDLNGRCPDKLMSVSSEIVEKCGCLPLAIVAIGGLLSSEDRDQVKWKKFSENLSRELRKNDSLTAVEKILGFSYHHLPYYLKQCLLYFGIYPEDYEVEYVRLIRQWIAEGFVKHEEGETLEEVAEQYLTELIHKNLVQASSLTSDDKTKRCRVHDLVRDMILKKISDLSFCHFASEHGMIRRLTIATSSNNLMESVESSNIRSLHIFGDEELPEPFVQSIPARYRLLKVLDFEDAPLCKYVPENLGNLFLLRYLSFRNTSITSLPGSIGKLHNLETLDLRKTMVREMPTEINKLKKLRHLLGYDTSKGVGHGLQMKAGIGDLASLQTLREVETNHGGVGLIEELERLTELRVLGLTNVQQEFRSVLCSTINKMQHLEKLHVAAKDGDEVIDLHFNVSAPVLRKLRLVGKLSMFPNWVAELQNLVKLSLSHSMLTHDPLASLKDLPNLLCLNILYRAYERECLHFPNGGFKNLKQLVLRRLYNLNSILIDREALPSLKKFMLVNIPQLKEVPFGVYNLPKLEVFHIMNMSDEFEQSIDRNRGQHQWIVEQVPFVSIVDRFWA